ncbi:hypothetical protein VTP01DRAFT_3913 [Rhizomucor pusillus]|uniref:uncharacterized protein n=1 Tax=Rhizomucor pusillus TaxID=4840 RepID=UPI003744AE5A
MSDSGQKKRKWDLDDQGKQRSGSESPVAKISKVEKEDSPKSSSSSSQTGKDALSEAAAKINAILAQKGLANNNETSGSSEDDKFFAKDKNDADFVKNIPINDVKNRYMLTRGATQTQIQRETGADVTTRGKYYPDKSLATESDPPLYLHVTASTKEALDKAVAQIEDIIRNAVLPSAAPQHHHEHPRPERRRFFEEKIPVDMEGGPHFNLRAKIVGPHGAYVKHIQNETGSRVQLKGRGSGFYETSTGQEADEPLHVYISCPREEGLEKAVQLTQDLLKTVRAEYERAKQYPYYGRGYGRGYGHHGYAGYGAPPPPPPPQAGAAPPPPPPAGSPPSAGTPGQESGSPQTATTATGDAPYPGYDYSQYYSYYGQYQYDPNYYNNYYGYYNSSTPSTEHQASPSGANDSASATPTSGNNAATETKQPPANQDYHAVPPPSQV